jgi:4-oxalocrotonate tautomerase
MKDYFAIVDRRPSPASRDEPRRDRIGSLEFAGPVTSFARVECAIGPKFFTDFLTLIRVDGRWQIISKVFHYDIGGDHR